MKNIKSNSLYGVIRELGENGTLLLCTTFDQFKDTGNNMFGNHFTDHDDGKWLDAVRELYNTEMYMLAFAEDGIAMIDFMKHNKSENPEKEAVNIAAELAAQAIYGFIRCEMVKSFIIEACSEDDSNGHLH